jgi:hypothetical protein
VTLRIAAATRRSTTASSTAPQPSGSSHTSSAPNRPYPSVAMNLYDRPRPKADPPLGSVNIQTAMQPTPVRQIFPDHTTPSCAVHDSGLVIVTRELSAAVDVYVPGSTSTGSRLWPVR